ncbi:MAG: hypothetical protein OQK32_02590 [Gammaproteobacteria bacterium]|nr:hypothetical protein [Gammaproteobacteria bacterium]MCW8923663.1 hypothetical protein [Gammaproteobacteria bacterium]
MTFNSLAGFFVLLITTTAALADQSNLRLEQNRSSDLNDRKITSIGALQFKKDMEAHIDLVHRESDIVGDSLALDFGGGYVFRGTISLFLGAGISLDYNLDVDEFNDQYYAEAGLVLDLTKKLGITVRQQHFFHQPDDYEKVIMLGVLFRH